MNDNLVDSFEFSRTYWLFQLISGSLALGSIIGLLIYTLVASGGSVELITATAMFVLIYLTFLRDMLFHWPVSAYIYNDNTIRIITRLREYSITPDDVISVKYGSGAFIKYRKGVLILSSNDSELSRFVDALVELNPNITVKYGLFY